MNTFEVSRLFRRYTDEPDQSFLSDADVALYCKLGYDEFRQFVDSIDPHILARHVVISVAGSRTYDLTQFNNTATAATTPSILGVNPNYFNAAGVAAQLAWGRMTKLLEVWSMGANPTTSANQQIMYGIVNNPQELNSGSPRVMLRGEYSGGINNSVGGTLQTLTWATTEQQSFKLVISHEQEIGLVYNPVVNLGTYEADWTSAISSAANALPLASYGATGGISAFRSDGLETWHDLVPLMAYAQYAITDVAFNQQLMLKLKERKEQLKEYLTVGRGNAHYVRTMNNPDLGGTYL